MIERIAAWGEGRDDLRAAILTSTRAVPGGKADALSDYDVILVVRDIAPYAADRGWIDDFGPVLVAYWDPVGPGRLTGVEQVSNVVQYDGTLKIDFTVWPVDTIAAIAELDTLPAELDAGYRVIADKDGLVGQLARPSCRGYVTTLPDESTFIALVNDFLVGVPYVAKCLLRDEIIPAKWCLDYDMRYVYLLPMLEWLAASTNGGEARVGVNGKGLKRLLPPGWWERLEATWAGSDIDGNWESLFSMAGLFARAGHDVGAACGFLYPDDLHERVMNHARAMRVSEFGGGPATDACE